MAKRYLGLGIAVALAGKPVMEGKGVLFKKFCRLDVCDLVEVTSHDPDEIIMVTASHLSDLWWHQLEDIQAPECSTSRRN